MATLTPGSFFDNAVPSLFRVPVDICSHLFKINKFLTHPQNLYSSKLRFIFCKDVSLFSLWPSLFNPVSVICVFLLKLFSLLDPQFIVLP